MSTLDKHFNVTCIEKLDEPGAANDIIVWECEIDETLILKIFIEKDGKTEISVDDDTTLSYETDTIKAVALAQKIGLKMVELITLWNDLYSPVIIKDDTVDFWHTKDDQEIEETLIVPWLTQQQGSAAVTEFVDTNLIEYQSSGFTQTW